MNLLIGIVVILCLVVCELVSPAPVEDVWTRVIAMLFVAACVPGLAIFQTFSFSRRSQNKAISYEQRQSSLQRLIICHSAVWLAASLLIVCSIQWQLVVRQNWGLNQWPLVDEVLILLPILLSLLASWWIFYDVRQKNELDENKLNLLQRLLDPKRLSFVVVRFRVYAALTLMPIGVFVFLKDLSQLAESFPTLSMIGGILATLLVFLGYPFLIAIVWNLKPISDPELNQSLKQFCRDHKLNVFGVRVWHTDNQILNAMVAGFVPGFRLIILTDAMISRFPREELFAILRHEAGHIRLWHMPIRVSFILLPLLVLAVSEYIGISAGDKLNSGLLAMGLQVPTPWLAPALMYAAYLAASLSWLSRKMEYEADLYAATHSSAGRSLFGCVQAKSAANGLLDALLRFASYFPQQLDRNTFLHPSLRRRMQRIALVRDEIADRRTLSDVWHKQQVLFLVVLLTLCFAAIIV